MMHTEERVGQIGELLVAQLLNGTLSEDKYDMYKDMVLEDGTHVEVKTQARWSAADAFTVYQSATDNNIKKCLSVDRLIFVEPSKHGTFRIFECTDRTFVTRYPRGNTAYTFPVSKMTLLAEITAPDLWVEVVNLIKTDISYLT